MSADFPPLPPLPPCIVVALPAVKCNATPQLRAQRPRRKSQSVQDVQPPPLPPTMLTDNGTPPTRDLSLSLRGWQRDVDVLQVDWRVSQVYRLRGEAESFLRAIDAEIVSLESELSELQERLR